MRGGLWRFLIFLFLISALATRYLRTSRQYKNFLFLLIIHFLDNKKTYNKDVSKRLAIKRFFFYHPCPFFFFLAVLGFELWASLCRCSTTWVAVTTPLNF
jgi:hypothetical protein